MAGHHLATVALVGILVGCSSGNDRGIAPKPEAWPRVETYSPDYGLLDGAPLAFAVNQCVEEQPTDQPGRWFSLRYPRYNATLFVTFTRAANGDEQEEVVANRLERMRMNAGGGTSELTRLTSEGGFHGQLLTTRYGSSTPVQLLAVGNGWVVSGAVALSNPADLTRPDSLSPVIDALESDMLYTLKHLKCK